MYKATERSAFDSNREYFLSIAILTQTLYIVLVFGRSTGLLRYILCYIVSLNKAQLLFLGYVLRFIVNGFKTTMHQPSILGLKSRTLSKFSQEKILFLLIKSNGLISLQYIRQFKD